MAKKLAVKKKKKSSVVKRNTVKMKKKTAKKVVAKAKRRPLKKVKKTAKKPVKKTVKKTTKKTAKKALVKRKKKVLTIPKGYHSITPYLFVNNATKAIAFYKAVFGAKEVLRMEHLDGKIGHSELKIGDAKIMLADECLEMNARSPQTVGGSPVSIHVYVKSVDDVIAAALSIGATLMMPIEDRFYGDRAGTISDPFGHTWYIATHIEDVPPAKLKKRAAEIFAKQS